MSETPSTLEQICDKVIGYYRAEAEKRFTRYESQEVSHCAFCLKHIRPTPGHMLDIGAGSGRDAAFFAARDWHVTAVEPAHELREMAQQKHTHAHITWLDDRLPRLGKVTDTFDHVHISAVLFHLPKDETRPVLQRAYDLLKDNGTLFIGLRNGPSDEKRPMFDIDREWVMQQAEGLFDRIETEESIDDFNRSDVSWSRILLRKK